MNKMTIADGLKYAEFLEDRAKTIKNKINQMDNTRTTTRIVSQTTTQAVEEQTEFVLNPKALMAEYDENAKELRLVRQAIEKANHTVEIDIEAKF